MFKIKKTMIIYLKTSNFNTQNLLTTTVNKTKHNMSRQLQLHEKYLSEIFTKLSSDNKKKEISHTNKEKIINVSTLSEADCFVLL